MDIGTLTGSIVLEDELSGKLSNISRTVREFGSGMLDGLRESELGWDSLGKVAGLAGVAIVGAATTAAAAIVTLGSKGSVIQGVEDQFNNLAESIGSSGQELFEGLNEGVKGTVDSMELMQSTTRLLSSGIKLTSDDMKIIASTAREMGKATGTDATQGLNTLSQALLTGQTRLLKRYGIQVDTIQAERDYAKQIGITRDELNQTDKLEAARISMLEGMRSKLNVLGESEVSFKEKLQQGTVAIGNWFDELAKGIANSDSVSNAMNRIGDTLKEVFGNSSQTLLGNILRGVDRFADAVAVQGPEVVKVLGSIKDAFVGIYDVVVGSGLAGAISDLVAVLEKLGKAAGLGTMQGVIASTRKEIEFIKKMIDDTRGIPIFMGQSIDSVTAGLRNSQARQAAEDAKRWAKEAAEIGSPRLNFLKRPLTSAGVIEGSGLPPIEEALRGPSKAALAAQKELAEQQNFINKLMGADALKAAKQYESALTTIGGATKLTVSEQQEFAKVFDTVIAKYKAFGPAGAATVAHFEDLKFQFDAATRGTTNFKLAMHAVPATLQTTGDTMDSLTSSTGDLALAMRALPPTIKNASQEASKESVSLGTRLVTGLHQGIKDSISRVPQIISNAIINGADWKETGAAIGTEVGSGIGASIGSNFGKEGGVLQTFTTALGTAIGALAGPLVSKLADVLHKSAGEDVVKRVGREWGISITEEMGNSIAAQAKSLFRGSRAAAEIFNLDALLTAGGGLTSENLDTMTHKLRDVFSMMDTGFFTAAQGAQVLDENFGTFAAFFEDGLISSELRDIVRLTQEAGIQSKAVQEFLQGQAGRARSGLEGVLAQSLRSGPSGGASEGLLPVSQEQFDRLSRLATVSFNAAIAAGEPFLDALDEMQSSFKLLNQATSQFGFTQSEAFGNISALSNFFSENEALGQSIQGTNDMLIALANSNLMTQQTFSDLGAIAVENYDQMIAGGLSNAQALIAQQDTLQTLWELMQEGTFTVDDQTQALIDQAVEAGAVGEAHMDAQERATQAMERAAQAMEHVGDVLSQVFGIAGDEAETFADRTVAAAQRAAEAMAGVGSGISIADPNVYSPSDIIPMAEGGSGTVDKPTLFMAGEAGTEDFAFSGAGRSFGSDNAALEGEVRLLNGEMRLLRSDMKAHERAMTRIVRDELLTTPRR